MASKSVVVGAVAFVAGLAAIYLWQGRREQPGVAEVQPIPINPAPALAPVPPPAPAPVPAAPVAQEMPPPAVQPVEFPGTEFDAAFKKIGARHSRFENEIPDPDWAPLMEDSWRTFYEGKPEVTVVSIQCKTTLCEVRLVGHGMDEKTLSEVALKAGTQSLDRNKAGKQIAYIGVATDGQGSSPVAVVMTVAAADTTPRL